VRKDHWKGMSAAQREVIAQEQLGQVLARRAAAAQAAAEEAAAAAEQHNIHRAVMQQVRGWLSRVPHPVALNSSTSGPLQGRGLRWMWHPMVMLVTKYVGRQRTQLQ
jgi:hypothetical protein